MLLLLFTACSNDDESANTSSSTNPIGYWMSTSENAMGLSGLIFSADGEILSWQYRTNPEPGQDNYVEYHWGYFWLDDTGALDISTRPRDSEPNPDEMYYKIQSLTNDCLVIRSWGGFAGIPLEKGKCQANSPKMATNVPSFPRRFHPCPCPVLYSFLLLTSE